MIYLIGSLRNPNIPQIAAELRNEGFEVFDDWFSPGPEADERWQSYEKLRGRTYLQALDGYHARHVAAFDREHLDRASAAVLVAPAGKSAHLELGYIVGSGKPGYVLLDGEPERYDVMLLLATGICANLDELVEELRNGDR